MSDEARSLDVATVIVTYKSALLTIESLQSLDRERSASSLSIRAVVVDNDSGDLPQIARAVAGNGWSDWVTLVSAPKNGGFAYGNNLGMQRAYAAGRPSYVYLLNPDAQVRRGAISALTRFLDSHPDVGIAGSSFETLEGTDWPYAFRFPGLLSELDQGLELGIVTRLLRRWVVPRRMTKASQPTDWICGASMMIRPEVLAAIGGMDENYFLYYEEVDFCRRARQAGFPTWYVPESRVIHIGGQSTNVTSATSTPRRLPAYWFESRRRYFAVSFGLRRAMMIDAVALLAHTLGWLKRLALLRRRTASPHFARDLMTHSVLWPKNRQVQLVRAQVELFKS
jgi:N-acetylglucosaminyl-diphospho-decaprenol L-rhamnosyltransferase